MAGAFVAGVSVVHSRLAVHFLKRLFSLTQISVITLAMAAFSAGVRQLLLSWPLTSSPSGFSIESSALYGALFVVKFFRWTACVLFFEVFPLGCSYHSWL